MKTGAQKITPFLWFDDQAEEAVRFYVSIFKNSRIVGVTRYGKEGAEVSGRPEGTVMTVAFQLAGQEFVALNGGPFSSSPRRYPLSSIANHRMKWTTTGKNCPQAETRRRSNAAG